MLFSIGTRVRFRYTGERGVITARLDDELLQVRLDSDPDLVIPAFAEDLLRDEDLEPQSPGAKFIAGKKEKTPEAPPRRVLEAQYVILKPKGLLLAFEPMPGRDGTVTRYKAWLVNDTTHEFLIELDLYTTVKDIFQIDDKSRATSALELGDLLYDDLNDAPEVWIRTRRITTAGLDEPLENTLKIRPKQFFSNLQTAPVLNLPAHVFVLLQPESISKAAPDDNKESLQDYTRRQAPRRPPRTPGNSRPFDAHNVEEFAHFIPEIDLHIDALMPGHARLDKSEILRIQLLHFQRFIDKAVRLGAPHVFVIHGVGEGKLRDAIKSRLRENPHVAKFKNEYHAKYGYGATEVIFDV